MKAVINEKETPVKKEYPWIGEATDNPGFIVAFWSANRATVLKPVEQFKIGDSYEYLDMIHLFTPLTGTITLSND